MIRLLVTSGRGPAECRIAVCRALSRMQREASNGGLTLDIIEGAWPDKHGPGSAIVMVDGDRAGAFAANWIGTAQWISQSPVRPNHRRKNWYIGIFRLPDPGAPASLQESEVRFETLRAGGPGGQHQNKTESAVRATHTPTGLAVVARSERSQHRNKAEALRCLARMLAQRADLERMQADKQAWAAHEKLERGGKIRKL